MLLRGKPVAWTTGTDVELLKDRLVRSYFHLPDELSSKKKKPR